MKAGLLMLTLGVLATATAAADDLPSNVFADDPNDDSQTLLFLGPARPAVIRLHIQVDGQSHRTRWDSLVRALISRLDEDKDGALSRTEFVRADPFRGSRPNPAYAFARQGASGTVADRPKGSDPADLFRPFAPPFSFQYERSPDSPEVQGVNIFAAIDRNKDGRVDRDEAAAASTSLASLDADDDGMISARELAPYRNPFIGGSFMVQDSTTSPRLADLTAEGSPEVRARKILERYDDGVIRSGASVTFASPNRPAGEGGAKPSRGHDGKLDRGEIILNLDEFIRADRNGDGLLDRDEIERGLATDPDAELIVRIGRREPGLPAVEVVGPVGPRPGGVKLAKLGGDGVVVDLGTMAIEIRSGADPGSQPVANRRAIYLSQFQAADLDKNGVIDRNERQNAPFLGSLFVAADHNGDGRLSEAELVSHFDLQAEVANLRTVLRAIEQGTSLLDLIDVDRDRRIGVRELRALPDAMSRQDRDGDGYVATSEIARHYRWIVALGESSGVPGDQFVTSGRVVAPAVPTFPSPPSAPTWFLKMDRNRDGDLSPREFLGPEAVFAAYDADGDGLISPTEAQHPKDAVGP